MATRRRPPVHVFDLVERTDKTLGLVWRVAGDVDSDDSEDDDSQVDEEPLADGQASVAWLCPDPPGAAQTELITGLQVLDRSLIVGDFVARASDPLGQTGMVVAVKQLVDLQTPGGASATGLPASCLAPVLPLQGGQSVLHRRTSWIGVIGQVMEMVVVQFDDGCIIELRDLDDAGRDTLLFCNQQDYMFGEEFDCLYYPGQRVMLPALHVLDEVNYRVLKGRRPTRLKGAVLSVTASRAAVDWLETLCLPEGTQGVQPPPEFVSAEELLPFSYFCRDNWHLGQWGILSSEYDPATVTGPNSPWTQGAPGPAAAAMASQQRQHSVFEREPAMDEDWPVVHPNVSRQRAKNRKRNARRRGHRHETQAPQVPELPPTAQVINTRTVVDVRWQDGGLEQGLAAAECLPFEQQDDHDFWPEDVVEEKADELADTPPAWRPRTGIVQRVNAAARTAVIKWLEKGFDDQAALMDIACLPETTVSVYAIQQHSVYAYALGEVAVLLDGMAERKAPESSRAAQPNGASASPRPNSHAGMPASAHAARSGQHTQQQQAQGASSVDSLLPCVGQIIGMQDGAVKVHWLDGHESVVTRNQIYIVNNEVDDMTDDEEGASEASAESEYTYEGSDYMEDDSDELSEDADERPSYISAGRAGGSPVYEDLERPPFPSRDEIRAAYARWQANHAANQSVPAAQQGQGRPPASDNDSESSGWQTASNSDDLEAAQAEAAAQAESTGAADAEVAGFLSSAECDGMIGRILATHGIPPAAGTAQPAASAQHNAAENGLPNTAGSAPRLSYAAAAAQPPTAPMSTNPLWEAASTATPQSGSDGTSATSAAALRSDSEQEQAGDQASKRPATEAQVVSAQRPDASTAAAAPEAGCLTHPAAPGSGQATSPLASGHAQPSHEAPATGSPAADASCASPSAEPVAKAESAANGSAGPSTAQPSAGTTFAPVAGFPQFEVLDVAPSGHHYMSQAPAAGNTRTFQKAVLKEWDSLRHNLPPSIWARAYESRMDLLRVLILGAAGTPYHNNLFCFDLQLPPDYPHSPPKLHYHSWGLRVNPNLYENGKVCLSLLGTWNGRASELWNPASSTLLQVLVSIQGLILVPKPYYNEAGFERQVGSAEGEKHARLYNENAFLLVCRSAMHILRRPPAPFEPLIQLHYNAHGATLLAACQAYLRGEAVVGQFQPAWPTPQAGAAPQLAPARGGGHAPDGTSAGGKSLVSALGAAAARLFGRGGGSSSNSPVQPLPSQSTPVGEATSGAQAGEQHAPGPTPSGANQPQASAANPSTPVSGPPAAEGGAAAGTPYRAASANGVVSTAVAAVALGQGPSEGFKLMLEQLLPRLQAALQAECIQG